MCAIRRVNLSAKGPAPEDILKGQIIISDKPLPTHWSSVAQLYRRDQLSGLNKGSLWYDKKTGKLSFSYAAFFARPVNDVQVILNIYDVTGGLHSTSPKINTENFMQKGDRVLFNTLEFDKEDFEGNKKYRMTIESGRQVIASTTFILRQEAPHYSGKVTFDEAETK